MGRPDSHVWDAIIAHVRRHHPGINRHWFDDIEPLELSGGTLRLLVREVVQLKYLQRLCVPQFSEAATAALGVLVGVRFVGEAEAAEHARRGASGKAPRAVGNGAGSAAGVYGMDDAMILSPDYVFDTFVIGPENELAHAAARAVVEKPGRAYNPLFIWGGIGLGKTHLLQAICLETLRNNPEARIHYTSCDDFMTQFHAAVQHNAMPEFRNRYRALDVLAVDDIHDLARQDRSQEEFFHTFNALYQAGRQIVLSSDALPSQIPDLEERLVSRFGSNLVASLGKPTFETRASIVRSKVAMRNVRMPEDVVSYIASRIDSNIRELEGAVIKIHGHASLQQIPITLDMARKVLGDGHEEGADAATPGIQTILDAISSFYAIRLTDLLSRKKHKSVVRPRQMGMWLARRHTRFSLEEIGGFFGGRDHTTVMHAVSKIEELRESDAAIRQDVSRLEERIRIAPNGLATSNGSATGDHAPTRAQSRSGDAPEIEVYPPRMPSPDEHAAA